MRPTALDDAHRIFVGWLMGIAWRHQKACSCETCMMEVQSLLSAEAKLRAAMLPYLGRGTAPAQAEERPS